MCLHLSIVPVFSQHLNDTTEHILNNINRKIYKINRRRLVQVQSSSFNNDKMSPMQCSVAPSRKFNTFPIKNNIKNYKRKFDEGQSSTYVLYEQRPQGNSRKRRRIVPCIKTSKKRGRNEVESTSKELPPNKKYKPSSCLLVKLPQQLKIDDNSDELCELFKKLNIEYEDEIIAGLRERWNQMKIV